MPLIGGRYENPADLGLVEAWVLARESGESKGGLRIPGEILSLLHICKPHEIGAAVLIAGLPPPIQSCTSTRGTAIDEGSIPAAQRPAQGTRIER